MTSYAGPLPPFAAQLSSLIAPIAEREFMQQYWRKRPFFRKGATERLSELRTLLGDFSPRELVRLSNRIEVWRNGVSGGSRDVPADVALEELDGGATLYFHLHHTSEACAAWVRALGSHLGHPDVQLSIFATRRESTPLHYDRNENFTIQLLGEKEWEYGEAPVADRPLGNFFAGHDPHGAARFDFSGYELPGKPQETVRALLQPGDILYTPAGSWHGAKAGDLSVSLNVNVAPTHWFRVILNQLEAHLMSLPTWRAHAHHPLREADVAPLLDELRAILGPLEPSDFCLPSDGVPTTGSPITQASQLYRALGAQILWSRSTGERAEVQLTWADRNSTATFDIDIEYCAALHSIATSPGRFQASAILGKHPNIDADSLLELLSALVRLGYLHGDAAE